MTHEELLEKIRVFLVATELQSMDENFEGTKMLKALHSVVELHKPCDCDEAHCDYCTDLGNLFSNQSYPCPTIKAIEKELM